MSMNEMSDGVTPKKDGVTYDLNNQRANTHLTSTQVFNALAWDQMTASHLVDEKRVKLISNKHSQAFRGAHSMMLLLASLDAPPKLTRSVSRKGVEYISNEGVGWLWNHLHWVVDLIVDDTKYDAYLQALFDCLRVHGFVGPEGLACGFNPNVVVPEIADKLDAVLLDLHGHLRGADFLRSVKAQLRARENAKGHMLFFFDSVRVTYDSSVVLRMEFQYSRDDYFKVSAPSEEGFLTVRKHLKKLIDTIRGRMPFKGNMMYFWKLSYGLYRGWSIHVIFFFNPLVIGKVDDPVRQFQSIWKAIAGPDGISFLSYEENNKFKNDPIGLLRREDSHKWASLMDTVEYWALSDQLILAKQFGRYHTFDHSEVLAWSGSARGQSAKSASHAPISVFSVREGDVLLPRNRRRAKKSSLAVQGSAFELAMVQMQHEEMEMLQNRFEAGVAKRKQKKSRVWSLAKVGTDQSLVGQVASVSANAAPRSGDAPSEVQPVASTLPAVALTTTANGVEVGETKSPSAATSESAKRDALDMFLPANHQEGQ